MEMEMERAIELMVSDEICELFLAMMKLDDSEEEENRMMVKKRLLGVNKSSIGKKKPNEKKGADLKRNLWGVNLSKEKREEMKKIEDELQGGREYVGVSRAPPEVIMGQKKKRFKAQITDPRGRRIVLGTHYKSAKKAASAHDIAAVAMYGLAIRLNFPYRVHRNNTTSIEIDQNKEGGNCETMVSTS